MPLQSTDTRSLSIHTPCPCPCPCPRPCPAPEKMETRVQWFHPLTRVSSLSIWRLCFVLHPIAAVICLYTITLFWHNFRKRVNDRLSLSSRRYIEKCLLKQGGLSMVRAIIYKSFYMGAICSRAQGRKSASMVTKIKPEYSISRLVSKSGNVMEG